ncbi:hypothetical protein V5799_032112 [Amblyomma americanum]|uniref:C2H2-type domain-containing protein n=1 Tax=Amblyomma americanum TaxID=6943 RepID=A0AAQ4DS36_AMBAM
MCPEDPESTQGERAYSMADQAEGNAWIDDYDDLLTTCSVCGEPFGARHLWLRSELHSESRLWYECHLCPTKFTRAHLLERHVKKHTSASQ